MLRSDDYELPDFLDRKFQYPLLDVQEKRIDNDFVYHAPKVGQPERYETIRFFAKVLAKFFCRLCPPSRELSLALTKLEEAVFWANAAIARNEPNEP